jgi:cytidine deaminase
MSAATQRLVQAAIDASKSAYVPYSNFHVGAALLLDDGQIVTGSNFENASYGMTLCAETVAIAKANSDGQLRAQFHAHQQKSYCGQNGSDQ